MNLSKHLYVLLTFSFIFLSSSFQAQKLTKEQLLDSVLPSFSAYKDNFFITGIPLDEQTSEATADVKYQISFKQSVTRSFLPFESHLFLAGTQMALWKIYGFSSSFEEVNFNLVLV